MIADCLWTYGELELAVRALDSSTEEFRRISVCAHNPTLLKGQSTTGHRSIAFAAVEALTGEARPPARSRARPSAERDELWRTLGRPRPSEPSTTDLLAELHGTPAQPRPPYTGPFVRSHVGFGVKPDDLLHHLRYLTAAKPDLLVGRSKEGADEGEVYAQAYRLGRGRVLVEHRDGSADTHQHVVVPTNAKAAALLKSW